MKVAFIRSSTEELRLPERSWDYKAPGKIWIGKGGLIRL